MKQVILFVMIFAILPFQPVARADLWGGDLPLLGQIVANTLHTLYELERQSSLLRDQMDGIKDRIHRLRTISELVQPETWKEWKDPKEAVRRLREIYYTIPAEYRTEKSDEVEREIARAMSAISHIGEDAHAVFLSGKELERRGADASPGVAQKLSASGVGTLITLEAQSQVLQSHITSLLTQMLANSNEREARKLVAAGTAYAGVSIQFGKGASTFSSRALGIWGKK